MTAITKFIDGTAVWAGSYSPVCSFTIACGSCIGFHALIGLGHDP